MIRLLLSRSHPVECVAFMPLPVRRLSFIADLQP
jgi:hypothetical protein